MTHLGDVTGRKASGWPGKFRLCLQVDAGGESLLNIPALMKTNAFAFASASRFWRKTRMAFCACGSPDKRMEVEQLAIEVIDRLSEARIPYLVVASSQATTGESALNQRRGFRAAAGKFRGKASFCPLASIHRQQHRIKIEALDAEFQAFGSRKPQTTACRLPCLRRAPPGWPDDQSQRRHDLVTSALDDGLPPEAR